MHEILSCSRHPVAIQIEVVLCVGMGEGEEEGGKGGRRKGEGKGRGENSADMKQIITATSDLTWEGKSLESIPYQILFCAT